MTKDQALKFLAKLAVENTNVVTHEFGPHEEEIIRLCLALHTLGFKFEVNAISEIEVNV